MKRNLAILLCVSLVACSSVDQDARRALTGAQQLLTSGQSLQALDALESVAKQFPQTPSATEALKLAKPLSDQKRLAIAACDSFMMDAGQAPRDVEAFYARPSYVAAENWKGPYASPGQLGYFGTWIVTHKCDGEPNPFVT